MSFKHVAFTFLFLPLLMFHIHSNAQEINEDEANRLKTFIKKRLGSRMPADATIEVKGYEKSSLEGFKKGEFLVSSSRRSGEIPFVISQDGKYLMLGHPFSLEQFEDTPIDGLKKGTLPAGRQPVPILLSTDGKHIILAEIIDSTVDPLKETMSKISLEDIPVKGDEKAQVTIVEYSDFQCPFCKRATDMLPAIMEKYEGKIKVFYKQLPLPNHNWAKGASIASVCASKQGNEKFWEFHDLVFENQKSITVDNSKDEFNGFAKKIGLNTDEFDKCLNSPDVAEKVQQEMAEAQSIGVSSTPTFVVNGMIVPGANPDSLKSAIDSSLSDKL